MRFAFVISTVAISGVVSAAKVNSGFFTNWAIYGRNFKPTNINTSSLSHIYYAFTSANPANGSAFLTDLWADQQITYTGDDTSASGNNLFGNLKQLYLLKQQKRTLKTILSFGGWSYSQAGHFNFTTDATSRATFVKTAIQLLEDNGFDGLDINWVYPTREQASALVSLLADLRAGLDAHAQSKGDSVTYQLSATVPAGASNYQHLLVREMDQYLTYWNLMTYDYSGSWSSVSDYMANVYGGGYSGVSTNATTQWYLQNGASASKFVIGMPVYGHAFQNTDGIFQPFDGTGAGDTWEAGVYDYKALPFQGATVHTDTTNISSYSYDAAKRELVAYDTPEIMTLKSEWLVSQGLAGAMFWELLADKTGEESLLSTAHAAGVMAELDTTENHLSYPGSQFDNLKAGMGAVAKRGHPLRAKVF